MFRISVLTDNHAGGTFLAMTIAVCDCKNRYCECEV